MAIYVSESVSFTERKEFYRCNEHIECLFIEVDKSAISLPKNLVIGVVYRPPGTNADEYNRILGEIISPLNRESKFCYITGDFNLDLFKAETHIGTSDNLDLLYSFSYLPMINRPTRITSSSATLIDNIFFNNALLDITYSSGIIFESTSDHFPIFHVLHDTKLLKKDSKIIKRNFCIKNQNNFVEKLALIDWSNLYTFSCAQMAYDLFHQTVTSLFDKCFPKVCIKPGYKTRKPWLNETIKEAIKMKNKLYIKSRKNPTLMNEIEYKNKKKYVDQALKTAEKMHYQELFEKYKGDLKKSWQLIKRLINKKKSNHVQSLFKHNDKEITDPLEIVERFNNFFVNVGPSTAAKIPDTAQNPSHYMKGNYPCSFYVTPVTPEELDLIIRNLKNSSSGWDELSAQIIKSAKLFLIDPLVFICNLSLTTGIFPDQLKVAKVLPLYKSDDPKIFSNYRPVSVLPIISKILERIMYNRLIKYLNDNKILYAFQFGFRKNHSAAMVLITLVDKISMALEDGEFAIGLFLDFSKAFDTINYEILYMKLLHYGIRGCALDWFKSYLSNRKQYVHYNGLCSSLKPIACGVPQGSILGPLLFLIYVNDIAYVSEYLFTVMFADDTNALISHKNLNILEERCTSEMIKVSDWVNANKLCLNVKKTLYMLFKGKKKIANEQGIFVDNKQIQKTDQTKFLGIIISDNLSWQTHIDYISKKVSKSIGILYRLSKFLNKSSLLSLYYSLIYPYYIYCNEVWGLEYITNQRKLLILQKRALRIICNKSRLEHTDPLFKECNILKLNDINTSLITNFMFKFYHKDLPNTFDDMFTFNRSVHVHYTRQCKELHVPIIHSNLVKMSIRYIGVITWNKASRYMMLNCTLDTFKRRLRRIIISGY